MNVQNVGIADVGPILLIILEHEQFSLLFLIKPSGDKS